MNRRSTHMLFASALFLSGALTTGCALLSKSDSVTIRYFTPERLTAPNASTEARPASPLGGDVDLKIGKISSSSYIRETIAYRDAGREIGFYEQWRWTEKPEAYVRRALNHTLFESGTVKQRVSGPGPTLEVEIVSFEELRAPRHSAHVEITWLLRDDHNVVAQKTLTKETPIAEVSADSITSALADALDEAVHGASAAVIAELGQRAATMSHDPP